MRLNVRCCCQPKKILGTFDVPDYVPMRPCFFEVVVLDGTRLWSRADTVEVAVPASTERLELRKFGTTPDDVELAVYSDDRPIEFWRSLPGFEEA